MSHITTGIIQGNQLVVVPIATTLRGAAGSAGATGPAGAAGPEGLAVVGVTGPVGGLDGAVTEHLVPETVGAYDLGASGSHFRDLWLDGESFYLWDKVEERYFKLAQEGGKIKPGWANELLAPMACSGDGGDELDSVGGTWAASTTYAAGDQVCHRDPGGSELFCYECEPPSVMASTISGVCCLDLDDTSGERCVNTTMANCCAEGGTLFYPNVTCAEIDNSETYWNICESGEGGGDPCQGFGDSDSSVDECLGTQPGETIDWKACRGEEEFVSTKKIKMRIPCDSPRLMRLGPQLKGENKGQYPYVQLWRGPYNVYNTGQYSSPSRGRAIQELMFADDLSTVERVWVGDTAVDEKSWYLAGSRGGVR